MESKTERPRSAPPVLAAAISMVLGDHDLLCEILLRLAFPDSLVRAAAVCRLWLLTASDPAFLRRFRELQHPAGLLGFYVTAYLPHHNFGVDFVPMQHHPPEVAALLRRVPFRLDAYVSQSTRILDCRAGRVVARLFNGGEFTHGVYTPLNPARGLDVFPRLPMTDAMEGRSWIFQEMLSKESANEVSYIWFTLELEHSVTEDRATGCVFELQDDAWCLRLSASVEIPQLEDSMLRTMSIFLADDKIYMGITRRRVLVLDLTSSTFSTIEFHDEMALNGEVRLARGNGSRIYLVHLDRIELDLYIWLHTEGNGGVGDWLLLHTIYLGDMLSNLKLFSYSHQIYIHEVSENADFVFLEMCGFVLYLDVKSRALQKVYEIAEKCKTLCWIHPFMMTWPPIFPSLKEE